MKTSTTFSRSNGILRYAALYILCLAAATLPKAAIAGEAYVTNSSRYSHGHSESYFDIESYSEVDGYRQFKSTAAKLYLDGSIGSHGKNFKDNYQTPEIAHGFTKKSHGFHNDFGKPSDLSFDDFTVHVAFSVEEGNEESYSETEVEGYTESVDYFKEYSHTSAAGIR